MGVAKDYAILVGLNDYSYLNKLKYAEKDAKVIQEALIELGYETKLLVGRYIGEDDILEAIRQKSRYSNQGDSLIFFFSGHGAYGDDEDERGLLTYNSNPDKMNYIVTQTKLTEALSEFKGKKLVFLDACYQGSKVKSLRHNSLVVDRKLSDEADFLVRSSASNQESHDGFYIGNTFKENGVAAYYLQKALEGEADSNSNNKLTTNELNIYFTKAAQIVGKDNEQDIEVDFDNSSRWDELIFLGESTQQGTQKGTLIVESTPSGAEIWIGGKQYGQTPKSFTADPGTYEVELRKSGYKTYEERVAIISGSNARVDPRLEQEQTFSSSYTPGRDIPEQILVKSGTFQMGNTRGYNEGESDEKPVHNVKLTYSYYIGTYEITIKEYNFYCEEIDKNKLEDVDFLRENLPVRVYWLDAINYCNWLSEKDGLARSYDSSGNLLDKNGRKTSDITKVEGYRLPTEAEWEYAARGGQKNTQDYKYAGSNDFNAVAWCKLNSSNSSQKVGDKKPNELGIYDMSGNAWEWCHDIYQNYKSGTQTNPIGPEEGSKRVLRGGCFNRDPFDCRVSNRYWEALNFNFNVFGFRIARTYILF